MTHAGFARFLGSLALAFWVTACSKHEPPEPAEPAPVASPVSAPPLGTAAVAPPPSPSLAPPPGTKTSAQEIPTEEDFEDESAAAISGDNLDAQLDALEREILAE